MTARSIASALVCVIVFAGCLMALPAADGAPTGEDNETGRLDTVLEKLGTEGEFGLSLKLDKGGALRIADTLTDAAPSEIADAFPIIKYLRETDSPDLEKYIISVSPELKALTITAEGDAYLFLGSEKVSDGYDYTIRFNGSLKASESSKLDAVDSQNPGEEMGYDAEITVTVDAVAVIHSNEDAIPQSISAKAVVSADGWGLMNYEVHSKRGEVSYTYVDAEKDPVDIGYVLEFQGSVSDDVTRGDIDKIVSGESLNRRVYVASSTLEVSDGRVVLSGFEGSSSIDLGKLYLEIRDSLKDEGYSTDSFDGRELSYVESVYFILQDFLQKECNVFLSEQTYRDLIDAGKVIWTQLRDGKLDFFYSFGGNIYNTTIKEGIVAKLDTDMVPTYNRITGSEGDYRLSYSKNDYQTYIDVEISGAEMPEEIRGFSVSSDNKYDQGYVNAYKNRTEYYTYAIDSGSWDVWYYGKVPQDVSVTIDGITEENKSKVSWEIIHSIDFDGLWCVRITISDMPYELFGKEIRVSCGQYEYVLVLHSGYGDNFSIINGVFYAYSDWNATAIKLVDSTDSSTVTISKYITVGDEEKRVTDIKINDGKVGELILDVGDNDQYYSGFYSVDLTGSAIGKLTIQGRGYVDFESYKGLEGVKELVIGDDVLTSGVPGIPGWFGVGSTFTDNSIKYVVIRAFDRIKVNVIGVSGDSAVIPKTVSYEGQEFEVNATDLQGIDIQLLDVRGGWAIELESSKIGELRFNSSSVRVTEDCVIDRFVLTGEESVWVYCDEIANIGAKTIAFEVPISGFTGDFSRIRATLTDLMTIDGLVYLKITAPGKNAMQFIEVADGKDIDMRVRASFQFEGNEYPVQGHIDASGNRSIRNVIIESIPDGGMTFEMSSVKLLQFDNEVPLELDNRCNFRMCDSLETVIFEGPVNTIGDNLFGDSTEIRSLVFKGSIERIGYSVFASNGYIKELVFEDNVGEIADESFGSFTKLESVVFKKNVGTLDGYAFNDCSKLQSVVIEGNIDELNGIFGCSGLKSISVKGTIGLIRGGAFDIDNGSVEELDIVAGHYNRIEGAFYGLKMSEETISQIISSSDYVSPFAFSEVIIPTENGNEPYTGVSSGIASSNTVFFEGYNFVYVEYVEDGKVSLDVTGVSKADGWQSGDESQIDLPFVFPDNVSIEGRDYPITSIGFTYTNQYYNNITSLVIGNNIKQIRSLDLFPQLNTLNIKEGTYFSVERLGSGDTAIQLLYDNSGDKTTFIDSVGRFIVEEYTIPEGLKEFNLHWIRGSTISTIVTGDDVEIIDGNFWQIEGLKTLVIGANVKYFDIGSIPDEATIEISDNNAHIMSYGGNLYRVTDDNHPNDLELIRYRGDSSEIISSFDKNGTRYNVISMGHYAFRSSTLDKIVLNDGFKVLNLFAFSYTDIKEIVVPNDIEGMQGIYYSKYDTQTPGLIIRSQDGQMVHTVDGMVYFGDTVVQYVGGGQETIYIEDGTRYVNFGPIYNDVVIKRIILPSTVENFDAWNHRAADGVCIDILAPSTIESYEDGVHIRGYSVSNFYDLSFAPCEDGLIVSVKLNHAESPSLYLGDMPIPENGKISWSELFPDFGSDKPGIYDGMLTVSYVKHTYTVKFDTGFVDTIPEQTVAYGDHVTIPSDPINGTYEFRGWFTDQKTEYAFDFDTPVTGDLILYAGWYERPEPDPSPVPEPEPGIAIRLCDGVDYIAIGDYSYRNGRCYLEPGVYKIEVVSERGYEGTPTIELDGKRIIGDTITLDKDSKILTVEGLYKKTNTVHFVNNVSRGTCATDSIKAVSGEPFDLPAVTPSDGYRFIGWTDGVTIYSGPCTVYNDASLFAAYVRDPQKMEFFLSEYTVSLSVPANGTLSSSAFFKADKGDTVSLPNVIPASGYRFNGWTLNGTNVGSSYTVLEDATLVASISKVGTSVPDTQKPDTPKPEEKVNEDGSTTVIDRKDDGSSVETTTKNNDDGSTVVKTEEKDKDGNTTGTTTKVTKSDGSSTEVKESKTENGSSVKEETFDKDGVSMGSTTKVTEKVTTDSGTTLQTEKVTAADGTGEKIAETVTVKAESGDGKLKSEATRAEKDGNVESVVRTTIESDAVDGKVELDPAAVSDALKQMGEAAGAIGDADSKVIEIGTKATTDTTHVSIPAESMKEISDAGADVKIAGDVGTITIGTDVSKNLAEKSSSGEQAKPVSMSIGKADKVSMTDKQRQAVGSAKVVRLQASVGDESVHELGGDVTITIPYVLSPGENPDLVRVYYVDDDGGLHMKLSKYDPSTHTVLFVTDHFSYYMIAQEIGAEQTADDGEDGFPMVAVVAAVVVIAVLAAVVVYRRTR